MNGDLTGSTDFPNSENLSPNEQVAQRIVARLLASGLIAHSQAEPVRHGLAAGTLKAADWRLLAENALEMEVRDAQAH